MRIIPVNRISNNTFKGTMKSLAQKCYGNEYVLYDGNVQDIPRAYDGRVESFLKDSTYPNAGVEKTLGDYHSKITGKVYIADPKEYIDEALKEQVDFVVYDNEPRYPDVNLEVSKSYFENCDNTNYAKKFEDIRDYYYRLQIADMKTAEEYRKKLYAGIDVDKSKEKLDYYNDRITKSQYQHDQALDCLNIYNKGYDLRCEKGKAVQELIDLERSRYNLENSIERAESDIKSSRARIANEEQDIRTIKERINVYKKLAEMPQGIDNVHDLKWPHTKDVGSKLYLSIFANEQHFIERDIPKLQSFIQRYENSIESLKVRIKDNVRFIDEAPQKLKELEQKISLKRNTISEIKGKLIPLFDELKHYYAARRILG